MHDWVLEYTVKSAVVFAPPGFEFFCFGGILASKDVCLPCLISTIFWSVDGTASRIQ